jgi:nucleotide-binding universal stress UspA family protein
MVRNEAHERVVVGVDGSPASALALAWAARYAKMVGADLHAVLAWHYPATVGLVPVGSTLASMQAQVEQAKQEELAKAVAATLGDPPYVKVEAKLVYGCASKALIDESADADLLVVGSRGHGGFTGMLLGSVSMQCVAHAACPVIVVRHPSQRQTEHG